MPSQVTGAGTTSLASQTFVEVDRVSFMGFPGRDECGRTSVAMSNDAAGMGKGRSLQGVGRRGFKQSSDFKTAGKVQTDENAGNYGFKTCQPVFTRGPSSPSESTLVYPFVWVKGY